MKLYWFPRTTHKVTYHLINDHTAIWQGIWGVQIGDYFIGVIKGRAIKPTTEGSKP